MIKIRCWLFGHDDGAYFEEDPPPGFVRYAHGSCRRCGKPLSEAVHAPEEDDV